MEETRKNNLIDLIKKAGSQSKLSKQIDLDAGYISQMKNGTRQMGEKTARKIEESLGLENGYMDSYMKGAFIPLTENTSGTIKIPMLSATASMGSGISDSGIDHDKMVRTIETTKEWLNLVLPSYSSDSNLRIITGLGLSMRGLYNDGDLLWCDTGTKVINHDAVYVLRVNGELFIKHVQRKPFNNTFELVSENRNYDKIIVTENDEFEVLGKILGALNFNRF